MCVRDWQSKKNPCGLNSPLDQVSHVHQNKTKQTLFLISSDCPVDSRLEQSLSIDVEQVFSLSLFPFIIMYIESIVGRRHWFFSFSPFFCVFRGPPKPFFSFVAAEREKTREEETQVIYKTLLSLPSLFSFSAGKNGRSFYHTSIHSRRGAGIQWQDMGAEAERSTLPATPRPSNGGRFFSPHPTSSLFPPAWQPAAVVPSHFFLSNGKKKGQRGEKKKHPANKKWGLGKRRQRRCSPIGLTRYPYVAVGVGGCVPFFPSLFSYRPTVVYIFMLFF